MVVYGLWSFRLEIVDNLEFFVNVDLLCYRIELGLKLTGVDRKMIFSQLDFLPTSLISLRPIGDQVPNVSIAMEVTIQLLVNSSYVINLSVSLDLAAFPG